MRGKQQSQPYKQHHHKSHGRNKGNVMPSQEAILREQYTALLSSFTEAFPYIQPPEPKWWVGWMNRHSCAAIHTAIQTLSDHHLKERFTTDSTGRAISALLREAAMQRVVNSVRGGSRE